MNGNVIRTITIRGTSEGLDKLTADVNKLAAAEQNVAIVSEQSAKRVLSLEEAWKRQTLKLDEAARAQANIARETKLADAALREGLATQQQHAQRLDQINQRYSVAAQSTQQFAQNTGLARHELINLGRQAQDVGVSLVSGQSPLMVLAQQGTQIADVFISSGKSVGDFFGQATAWAGKFFTSTVGIVTGVAAIGVAAVYVASQFIRASTTIEEALERQNRLLKEGKALIDQRTSAEARAQLQSRAQTQFETLRNQIDLQIKLNKAMEDATKLSGGRATTPTEVPGEMGVAPTAFMARSGPGMAEMAAAFEKLKAAQDAGLPGLKEYNAELAKIGLAHPSLALIIEDMIKAGESGLQLEFAAQRAKAMSDALAGIATNAQMAAVGLGSIAQFKMNNLQAEQAKEATERQAVAVLQMAQQYPGMSIEVAKQLNELQGQLAVAQQLTGLGQINAQYAATYNNLLLQGKTAEEALALATAQRAISLAQVNAEADRTLKNLQEQGQLIRAASEDEKGRIKAAQEYNKLLEQGVDAQKAGAIAAQMQANARAEIDAQEDAQAERDAATAAQDHARATEQAAAASERVAQAAAEAQRRWEAAAEALKFVPFYLMDTLGLMDKLFDSNQGGKSQFNPAGYKSTSGISGIGDPRQSQLAAGQSRSGITGIDTSSSGSSSGSTLSEADAIRQAMTIAGSNFAKELFAYTRSAQDAASLIIQGARPEDWGRIYQALIATNASQETMVKVATLEQRGGTSAQMLFAMQDSLDQLINLIPDDTVKAQLIEAEIAKLGQPSSLAEAEVLQKLIGSLEQLRQSTDNLAETMTDVLSPFYTSDPRRTHLGFRSFAGGGIMSPWGEIPINRYAGGGIANSPQMSVFGEGSTPEAYVPVPSGRIPVELKQPANSNQKTDQSQRPIQVNITVQGNADSGTVAALKQTGFQQAQAMRRMLS